MKVISDKGKKNVLPFPENQLKSESNENTAETRGRGYFRPSSAASRWHFLSLNKCQWRALHVLLQHPQVTLETLLLLGGPGSANGLLPE